MDEKRKERNEHQKKRKRNPIDGGGEIDESWMKQKRERMKEKYDASRKSTPSTREKKRRGRMDGKRETEVRNEAENKLWAVDVVDGCFS